MSSQRGMRRSEVQEIKQESKQITHTLVFKAQTQRRAMSSLSIYLICSLWHVFLIRLGACFASAQFIVNIVDGYNKGIILSLCFRRQNSPYFCLFKYARAVKQKAWNEAENRERDQGETLVFFVSLNRARLLPHALPISLLILRKNDCFAVYLCFCHLLFEYSCGIKT